MRLFLFTLIVIALFAPWVKPARADGEAIAVAAAIIAASMIYAGADAIENGPDDDDD